VPCPAARSSWGWRLPRSSWVSRAGGGWWFPAVRRKSVVDPFADALAVGLKLALGRLVARGCSCSEGFEALGRHVGVGGDLARVRIPRWDGYAPAVVVGAELRGGPLVGVAPAGERLAELAPGRERP